jgi:hypothetical protein
MPVPKEEIEKALKIKGEINGMGLLEDKSFFLNHFGKEKLKEVEKEISEIIGEDFSYEKVKAHQKYPFYLTLLATLILYYDFGRDENLIREFGKESVKFSLTVKLFLRYTFSTEGVINYGPKLWRKYFSIGDIEVEKYNKNERIAIIVLKNFDIHPLFCKQTEGAIEQLFSYVTKDGRVKNEEIECVFRGDPVHKFKISW